MLSVSTAETLRRILELESSRGYDNKSVIGGLQSYLKGCALSFDKEGIKSVQIKELQELLTLGTDYSDWTRKQRNGWVQKVMATLDDNRARKNRAGKTVNLLRSEYLRENGGSRLGHWLDQPISTVSGIGKSMAVKFGKLGVQNLHDLLYFFPRRYLDYSLTKKIREVVSGEEQTIVANIWQASVTSFGGRRGTEAVVGDETGNIRVVWFNQPYLAKKLTVNAQVVISGRVHVYKGQLVFESPEWELLEERELLHAGRLVPIYPLTRGLYPRQLRTLMKKVLDDWAWQVEDFLPEDIKRRAKLIDLPQAILQAHFPESIEQRFLARERLAFDELFLLQLGVLDRKREWQEDPGCPLDLSSGVVKRFLEVLPFTLTPAQQRSLEEIQNDIVKTEPMTRLLQGDVGSGKTVVAAAILIASVASGYQAALMAPTQILAEQHFKTLIDLIPAMEVLEEDSLCRLSGTLPDPVSMALLTGSTREKQKEILNNRIKEGEIGIVIGTHALIQKEVEFKDLAVVVIDEQHRFGVMQRSALRQKGFNPHMLVMTATPIPRTLALTLYGDLDISIIDELPAGRQKVKTRWLAQDRRDRAYEFVRQQAVEGRQAFVICPLIEESESIQVKAAVSEYERLSRDIFPDLRLGLLHGRMSGNEKDAVMQSFRDRDLDILVSTPVVEVGIDIPNATVMLVEGADRFGLSQLHQFRGRVGRGDTQSYCLLLAEMPSAEGRERLSLIEKTYDGFALAEEDLRIRGPGEFFGTRQSGMPDLRMAKLTDITILEKARAEAIRLFKKYGGFGGDMHYALAEEVARMWKGDREQS